MEYDLIMELRPAAKPRVQSEVVMRLIQPLADAGVRFLARLGVNPLFVVLAHALLGFVAAGLLASAHLVPAALLLQAKTLLDNMDGGLARATNRVTLMGRYLDTGLDLLVNAALFLALASFGPPILALLAFLLLTLILSLDYNAERLYRLERNPEPEDEPPIGAPEPFYRFFKGLYDLVLAPQDRFIRGLERWGFARLAGLSYDRASLELRLAWANRFSSAIVNLGLSSQMVLLGLCLVAGQPFWYVYAVFIQALYVLCVQLLRGVRFRRYRRGMERRG